MSFISRYRPIALLIAGAVVLTVTVAIGFGSAVISLRDRALANGERELRNIAVVLAAQTDEVLHAVNFVYAEIVERIKAQGIDTGQAFAGRLSNESTRLELQHSAGKLAHLDAIMLIDASGRVVNSSRAGSARAVDLSDRDYFKALKLNPDMRLFVGEPVRNRDTGAWTLPLARKVTGKDGRFIGLILGTMGPSTLETSFGSIALAGDASIAMLRRDGALLARYPPNKAGLSFINAPPLQKALSQAEHGVARLDSGRDGERWLVALKALQHFPVAIAVVTTTSSALANWRYEARTLAIAAVLAVLLILFVTVATAKQVLQGNRHLRRQIEAHKRQLDTAISNMSQGLIMFDASKRLVLVNRPYLEMYRLSQKIVRPGCTLYELIRHRKETGSFIGDVKRYCAEIEAAVAKGKTTSITVETADGRFIHIVNQPLPDGGWIVTHEDITEQRKLERERDEKGQFLDLVLENIPTAIAVKDADTRKYVLLNRAAAEMWNVDRGGAIGKTASELFAKECADDVNARDEATLRTDREVFLEDPQISRRPTTAG